jgi:DNA-binding GntR family transcriptional regulator
MTLASLIRDDLSARITTRRELPLPLTLASLARHYGVSHTPVRVALRDLVARRYLEKNKQGRLYAPRRPAPAGRRTRLGPQPSLTPNHDRAIAAELIERSLRGETAYIREQSAAEKFGVGRTVIRQVFSRLAGQGLLEHVPRCGWRVRRFDEADMAAYLEIRETLELKALDLARPRLVRTELEEMLSGNRRAARGSRPRLDNRLHSYLIEKSQNRYIQEFFARHGVYYTTLFDHAALGAALVARMARQHRAILRPMLDGRWALARRALARHIRFQRPIVARLLAQVDRQTPAR